MKVYDTSFDLNEWFILINIIVLYTAIWIAPKIFTLSETFVYLLYGFYFGSLMDQTLSLPPWDFYDVNDNSSYELFDFLSYFIYGPFSYFFIYFYVKLEIHRFHHITFIAFWTIFALIIDWIGVKVGLFHFDKGYQNRWSVPLYTVIQTFNIILYNLIQHIKIKKKEVG